MADPDQESTNVRPHHNSMVASMRWPLSMMTDLQVAVVPEKVSVGVTCFARRDAFAVMLVAIMRTSNRGNKDFLIRTTLLSVF